MNKKELKQLRLALKLTAEQSDVFDKAYADDVEPYKSFLDEESFNKYLTSQMAERESEAINELKLLKEKERNNKLQSTLSSRTDSPKQQALLTKLLGERLTGDENEKQINKLLDEVIKEHEVILKEPTMGQKEVEQDIKIIPQSGGRASSPRKNEEDSPPEKKGTPLELYF